MQSEGVLDKNGSFWRGHATAKEKHGALDRSTGEKHHEDESEIKEYEKNSTKMCEKGWNIWQSARKRQKHAERKSVSYSWLRLIEFGKPLQKLKQKAIKTHSVHGVMLWFGDPIDLETYQAGCSFFCIVHCQVKGGWRDKREEQLHGKSKAHREVKDDANAKKSQNSLKLKRKGSWRVFNRGCFGMMPNIWRRTRAWKGEISNLQVEIEADRDDLFALL